MEELYRQNAKIVYHFLYRQCRDGHLAEDLTQETFLQAYRSIDRYDGTCKLSAWLCQIAKHLLYRHWEKTKHEIPVDEVSGQTQQEGKEAAGRSDTERQAITRIELLDVLKELHRLPEEMREVMYLRIIGDLSFREIGEIVGHSENWARVNFFRGKEKLLKTKKEVWHEGL